jgi:hypothetical protein
MLSNLSNLSYASQELLWIPSFPQTHANGLAPLTDVRYIFTHTPRTGGTGLTFLLDSWKKIDADFHYARIAVPRIPDRSPNYFTVGSLGGFARLANDPAPYASMDVLSGHMPVLSAEQEKEFLGADPRPIRYLTVVRDPVDCLWSNLRFDHQRGYLKDTQAWRSYLGGFIDNLQTRLMAGTEAMKAPQCTEEIYQQALDNLEQRFALAVPTEAVVDMMGLVAAMLGIQHGFASARHQISQAEIDPSWLDETLASELAERHRYDRQLYQWVQSRWQQQKISYGIPDDAILPDLPEDTSLYLLDTDIATTRMLKQDRWSNLRSRCMESGNPTWTAIQVAQHHSGITKNERAIMGESEPRPRPEIVDVQSLRPQEVQRTVP